MDGFSFSRGENGMSNNKVERGLEFLQWLGANSCTEEVGKTSHGSTTSNALATASLTTISSIWHSGEARNSDRKQSDQPCKVNAREQKP